MARKKFVQKKTVNELNSILIKSIIMYVLFIVVGAVMLFLPNLSNKIIGIMTGVICILNGIMMIYKYLKREGAKLYVYNIAFGIISILLGATIILVPSSVVSFITVMLGIYLIVVGANRISYGVWFKIGGDSSWLITVVMGVMTSIFGIMVIANPFSALTLTQVTGTFIIISSVLDITDTILLKRRIEKIIPIFW